MMQPLSFLLPVAVAILLWWFSTGLIVAAYGRSRRGTWLAFGLATLLLALALAGVVWSRGAADVGGVYLAVACGIAVWGWQTAAYYFGFVTGPALTPAAVQAALRTGDGSWARFAQVLRASLYHELLVAAFAALLLGLTWAQPNRWAFWIYLALWLMHSSARLNVFLGVRNFHIEFLPAHMYPLAALLGKRRSNTFLPLAVMVASSVTLLIFYRAIVPGSAAPQTTGLLLTGTLLALGVLEHALLVIPLPATLYGWGVRALPPGNEGEPTPADKDFLRAAPETDWV